METFIIFIMSSVGLTTTILISTLFKPVREYLHENGERIYAEQKITRTFKGQVQVKIFKFFGDLVMCSHCCGFWTGVLLYPFVYKEFSWNIIIFGLISSIASYTYAELIAYVKRS